MKIQVIDDQQLVLLSLQKSLSDLGYEVKCSENVLDALDLYDEFQPDLVISDINLPIVPERHGDRNATIILNETAAGLRVLQYIRNERRHKTPVMILSGNVDEHIIEEGFELGANDYMKKPLSLTEITLRVKRLIGSEENTVIKKHTTIKQQYIQDTCVGVVIPCYNEEKRLLSDEFRKFVNTNLGYHLCFVNDGSTDNTLKALKELKKGYEGRISVYNCKKNGGKAEAVRQGMLHLAKQKQFDYIGFLDADLSTNFDDFSDLVSTIRKSEYTIVSGSRIQRMGANIAKESARQIISKAINLIIRKTLGMQFRDTQCGAKVVTREMVEPLFSRKFLTKWLFDVEVYMRMKKIYGSEEAKKKLCELPLKRWVHADGSKLSFKDSFKILGQIGQIAFHYR
ncbi:glycosyltransferase [Flavobacterium rhizosphaerae]|uniref:dolichyl-phosphate beta-glucosyltransferase n=1 Tax=Flavobacterium rhizosphaerae TaxID=3163298 RepID=A0ABW8YXG5_9FLAO